MYIHNIDPVLINFGFIEIRWYSLAYIAGILIGWWFGKKILAYRIKNYNISFNLNNFDDLIFYIIIGIILGGRLGYVFFYNLEFYSQNLFDIFKIWKGGMSFHGGLIGVIISTYIFSKKTNIKSLFFLDIIACVAPVGLFFGRIANFINAELYGVPTNLNIGIIFPTVDNLPRHPSQLYEAFLEGALLFIILNFFIFNKKTIIGFCSGLFLIGYGSFRVFVEQFREPDSQIGYLISVFSMGSILSFVMIFIGILILIKNKKNESFK